MKKLLLLLLLLSSLSYSKIYPTGLLFDDEAYDKIPLTSTLTRGSEILPLSVSLEKYAPSVVGNQKNTGTCTAWATAYGARTILESISQERLNRLLTTKNVFSPSYIYNQIRLEAGCKRGTYIENALKLMKDEGVAKFNHFGFNCNRPITYKDRKLASSYKIQGYKRLIFRNSSNKTYPIKKALSEKKPIVIGMMVGHSFMNPKKNDIVWQSTQKKEILYPHAMVVIGYDDTIEGGSFRLMNSWDKTWGDNGFIWVRYHDFQHFVYEAYELIPKLNPQEAVKMGGNIRFINTRTKTPMNATYSFNQNIYIMNQSYPSGTRFNFEITNQEPIYLYALGFDNREVDILFPHNRRVSAYQGYKNSTISYPDEYRDTRIVNTKGKEYFIILYSKFPLKLDKIKRLIENQQGNIQSRLKNVFGSRLISGSIRFAKHQINFDYHGYKPLGQSSKDSVVAIVVEFNHIQKREIK